ncbi:MAG: ATP synthase F0 subunit B [Bradymonadales bacterium]|jgi:F-type H+-transporting ATPase subunit b
MRMFFREGKPVVWTITLAVIIVLLAAAYFVLRVYNFAGTDPVMGYLTSALLPQIVNTSIVILVIGGFGGSAISKYLQARKEKIEREMLEANEAKLAAEKKFEQAQARLDNFDKEEREMQASYEKIAQDEREYIIAEARKQASNFERDARTAQETQRRQQQRSFELELMHDVLLEAEQNLSQKLAKDVALRNKLIDQSIAALDLRA